MKQIETSIEIKASKKKVWEVLTTFENYPNWNPFIKSIKGNVLKGETIEINLQLEDMKLQTFKPEVLVFDSEKEFRWKGKLGINGIFDGEHYFILESIDNQTTKLIHGENFSGILSGLIYKIVGEKTEKGFNQMNKALADSLH